MKTVFLSLILVLILIGCGSSNNRIGWFKVLTMNQDEFNEIKKISVEDERGFKYIKTTLEKNKFSSISTTTESQEITNEENEKIKAILKKY